MNKKKIALLWSILAVAAYGEASVDLDKTTIYSTTGFETELRKTASNPTLVTSKEIEEKNYKTVEEILNDIPAVNVVRQGKDYIIDLRGQGEKAKQNVQILVDGVQMNSLDTSMAATPINTISPDDIDRIEVLPGGGSVLYGSGTSGGVVNIITKKGTGKGTKVNAGYEYGSFANRKANVAVGQSIGDFDVNLSYTNVDRNGYRDDDTSKSDNFMGNVRYKINDKQDVNFKYSRYTADETYPKMLTREQVEKDRQQSGLKAGEYNTTDTKKDEYALTYNNKLTDNLDFSLTGFYQKTTMDIGMKNVMFGPFFMKQSATFEDEKWGVKPKFRYSYGEGSSLIFGMDYINNKATRLSDTYTFSPDMSKNPGKSGHPGKPGKPGKPGSGMPPMYGKTTTSLTTNDLEKETISAYVMNNYVWKDFEFAQGIRYEKANYETSRNTTRHSISTLPNSKPENTSEGGKFTSSDDNLAYELSANWLYSDTGKTYVRYEKGFTSAPPSLLTDKLPNGTYVLNDLEAETYDNFEIGLSDYIGITSINASIFYTVTKDEITQDMSKGMPPAWIYNYNLGKTERFGLELKTEQYFDKLTLSQSYSYINTEIKDGEKKDYNDTNGKLKEIIDLSGNHIANVPEHKLNLGANYAITDKLSVGGDIVYMSGIYVNNQNQGGKVNSHTVVNVRARYAFENGLDVYAGVNNLFNKKYYEDVDFVPESTNPMTHKVTPAYLTYDPAAERNYYVGFKYTF